MKPYFNNETIRFREVQQFRQSWIWVLLIFSAATSILLPSILLFAGRNNDKGGGWAITVIVLIQAINLTLFYIVRLETVVTNKNIYYRWWPFFRKYSCIPVNEIAGVRFEKWSRSSWGYAKTKQFGKSHTVSGDKGVALEMKDGRKYYIGSQEALTLQTTCEQVMQNPWKYA